MKQVFTLQLQTSQMLDNAIEFSDRSIFNQTVFLYILICKNNFRGSVQNMGCAAKKDITKIILFSEC